MSGTRQGKTCNSREKWCLVLDDLAWQTVAVRAVGSALLRSRQQKYLMMNQSLYVGYLNCDNFFCLFAQRQLFTARKVVASK